MVAAGTSAPRSIRGTGVAGRPISLGVTGNFLICVLTIHILAVRHPYMPPIWTALGDRSQRLSDECVVAHQDAIEALQQLPDRSVDCIWTDPPYFLSNGGISYQNGRVCSVNKGSWDLSRGYGADLAFHSSWVRECFRILRPGGTLWASGTYHAYLPIGHALNEAGFRILNDIVWAKTNPPPNVTASRFVHASEILLWATRPGARHTFNHDAMRELNGGSPMQSVWRIRPPHPTEKKFGRHPTQKPVELVSRCMVASTRLGDLVVDPFMGSGTTGVAALRLGRRFLGVERDSSHLDLAIRRLTNCEPFRWNVIT